MWLPTRNEGAMVNALPTQEGGRGLRLAPTELAVEVTSCQSFELPEIQQMEDCADALACRPRPGESRRCRSCADDARRGSNLR